MSRGLGRALALAVVLTGCSEEHNLGVLLGPDDAGADSPIDAAVSVDADSAPDVAEAGFACPPDVTVLRAAPLDGGEIVFEGDTTGRVDTTSSGTVCAVWSGTIRDVGVGAPDMTFAFTTEVAGPYIMGLRPMGLTTPGSLTLRTECGNPASCIGSVGLDPGFSGMEMQRNLAGGTTYYLVVDGYLSQEYGPFQLYLRRR